MRNLTHTVAYSILTLVLIMTAGCAKENWTSLEEVQETVVSFSLSIDNGIETRAIADARLINQLIVIAKDSQTGICAEVYKGAMNADLNLRLISGRTYDIVFWAQNEDAYTISDGVVSANYSEAVLEGGFSTMESLDAFSARRTVEVGKPQNDVTLYRSVAQLNFADDETNPVTGTHKAVVEFSVIPTSLNLFTGDVVSTAKATFTFADFTDESLSANNGTYNYVASNYILAPSAGTTVGATLDFQNIDGTSIKTLEFKGDKAISIAANKRTNVLGAIVELPVTVDTWDGITLTEPEADPAHQNRYIIDQASDLAWLSSAENTLTEAGTFVLTTDLDMNGENFTLSSAKIPAGSTIISEGSKTRTIKNANVIGALFGDVTNLIVENINVEGISVSSDATHVGVLANTLKGSSSFTNVTIKDATVSTSNGAAGGIVGYIVRNGGDVLKSTETLNVTFNNCKVESTSITGSISEGHFVGLLRGYDNGEVLSFNNCEAKTPAKNVNSYYINANKAEFVPEISSDYDGFLGTEGCFRGIVNYGSTRFIPKWDGIHNKYNISSKIFENEIPLLPDEKNENGSTYKPIYSAFDLAHLQNSSPGSIRFLNNVDMGGVPQNEVNIFEPISSLSYLYGNNKSIYNLYIKTSFDNQNWYGGAFVRMCRGGVFENLTIYHAHVEVDHVDGNGYASILLATAEGDMTVSDVQIDGGYLYGVNKMGGIIGYISGTMLKASNCSVSGLEIVSDKAQHADNNPIFAIFGIKTNGEIGGMFGFITANAEIKGCSVDNTTLDCIGTDNGQIGVFSKKNYAGRHVNVFIGDIRTTNGQTIKIQYNSSDFFGNQYLNRQDEYKYCDKIGHLYYTDISYLGQTIKDIKGTVEVAVDGGAYKSLTIPNGY